MNSPTHRFQCTLCGDCCTGRQEVRLNGEDLERMAAHLGLSEISELYARGLVEDVGENGVTRPRIRFRTKPFRFCPFLINEVAEDGRVLGRCSLHPLHKPLVCALSPLARTVTLPEGTEEWSVVAPVQGCPGMGLGPEREIVEDVGALRDRLDRETDWFRERAGSAGETDL